MEENARAALKSLVVFSTFGLISFIVGLGVLFVLYDVLLLYYWIAVPLSVMVHLVIHYILSRSLLFTKTTRTLEEGFLIFFVIGIVEIIFITGSVTLIVEYGNGDVYWTRILAGLVAALGGFWANARFNFRAL